MTTFLIACALFGLVFLAMGVGVLCGRRPLKRGCARLVGPEDACAGCERRRSKDGDCA